jgi:fatty-acyl-CoA synthase
VSVLTSWLTDPADGHGIHLATDGGEWEYLPYPKLAENARRVGAELVRAGVCPGDVVCMLMPTGFPLLATLFGTWLAGATPSLVLPPSFQSPGEYVPHVAAVLRQAQPALVAACDGYEELIAAAMAEAGRPGQPWTYRTEASEITPRPPGGLALLQFTSGSTAEPRGVRATWENLQANTALLHRLLGWRGHDAMASWLPLYHDMGLIGALLTTVRAQGDLWLMQPEQFIRRPLQWLACMQPGQAVHTMSPAFTFAYLARRIRPAEMAALDLSQWRTATIGAETIDPAALASFARLARPAGFSSRVFRPGYGLAEATLAVTIASGPGEGAVVRPDPARMRFGQAVPVCETTRLSADLPPAGWLIGHGRPAPEHGAGLTIVDGDGAALPDGYLGEIVVTGPSVTGGYHGGQAGGSTRFEGRRLLTGDAGFIYGEDLFVLGRMGDSLKVKGASVYVEDLDVAVAAATGLYRSRLAVVGAPGAGQAGVVLFAEAEPGGEWAAVAREVLRRRLGAQFPVTVVAGGRGLISKTSSGKPRRREMWQLLQANALPPGSVVDCPAAHSSAGEPALDGAVPQAEAARHG